MLLMVNFAIRVLIVVTSTVAAILQRSWYSRVCFIVCAVVFVWGSWLWLSQRIREHRIFRQRADSIQRRIDSMAERNRVDNDGLQ